MSDRRHARWIFAACLALAFTAPTLAGQKNNDKDKEKDADARRPRVTLKAQPTIGVAPSRVVLTAELLGGANDFEEFYCPTIEWDWGDETVSESSFDCDPYEAGKSEIRRRFTVQHIFRRAGAYRIMFRLKRHDKALAVASANIQIQPGPRDISQ